MTDRQPTQAEQAAIRETVIGYRAGKRPDAPEPATARPFTYRLGFNVARLKGKGMGVDMLASRLELLAREQR